MSESNNADPSGSAASQPVTAEPDRTARRVKSSTRNVIEWVAVIVGAVLVALIVKTFVVQAFQIPSPSMEQTLTAGDRVLVNKLGYDSDKVSRGDVLVFSRPPGLAAGPDDPKDLIKRVIGLPGDELRTKDGAVYVNGRRLEEPYVDPGSISTGIETPIVVPEGQFFMMGDNRQDSADSRVFGPIDAETVTGRAFMVMWPIGRIAWL